MRKKDDKGESSWLEGKSSVKICNLFICRNSRKIGEARGFVLFRRFRAKNVRLRLPLV